MGFGGQVLMPRTSVFVALLALLLACGGKPPASEDEIPVRVGSIALDQLDAPVVILQEENGTRSLPIWIGTAEAISIASVIHHEHPPRPNFHDLAQRLIQGLEAEVERVVVTELRGNTYYAELTLRSHGRRVLIDVRPSDGIAVALRARAPILVRAKLFEATGDRSPESDAPEQEI